MSLVIAHQDRRVVQTQRPRPSALAGDEELFQADRPTLEYRRRRQEAKDEAARAEPAVPVRPVPVPRRTQGGAHSRKRTK